jgi:lipoyl(octanoyl) transferase
VGFVEESDAYPLRIRVLGEVAYRPVWEKMQTFTQNRDAVSADELWVVQHPPVFTLGRNGKMEHVLAPGDIPVIPIDRGGQVTYHGPGQLVIYLLLDIRRKNIAVRDLVMKIEQSVVDLLSRYGISAEGDRNAPGVYVQGRKIAALGLRVTRGRTYHGLSLNVDMDLEPFQRINPCGYAGLQVTQCKELGIHQSPFEIAGELCGCMAAQLGYPLVEWCDN